MRVAAYTTCGGLERRSLLLRVEANPCVSCSGTGYLSWSGILIAAGKTERAAENADLNTPCLRYEGVEDGISEILE